MGLARTEKTGYPCPIGKMPIIGFKKILQTIPHLASQHILVQFKTETGFIVRLDDTINMASYVFAENFDRHG